jgi:hypothetical protein
MALALARGDTHGIVALAVRRYVETTFTAQPVDVRIHE